MLGFENLEAIEKVSKAIELYESKFNEEIDLASYSEALNIVGGFIDEATAENIYSIIQNANEPLKINSSLEDVDDISSIVY